MLSKYDPYTMDETTTKFFTGLSWNVYSCLCRYLKSFLNPPKNNLALENQITLFLARARLNLPLKFLSYQVGHSLSSMALFPDRATSP